MSLYAAGGPGIHRIPEAKLFSRDEDRNASQGLQLSLALTELPHQDSLYAAFALLALTSVTGLRADEEWQYISIPKPWCRQFGVDLSAFFLRPPPDLLSAFIL